MSRRGRRTFDRVAALMFQEKDLAKAAKAMDEEIQRLRRLVHERTHVGLDFQDELYDLDHAHIRKAELVMKMAELHRVKEFSKAQWYGPSSKQGANALRGGSGERARAPDPAVETRPAAPDAAPLDPPASKQARNT